MQISFRRSCRHMLEVSRSQLKSASNGHHIFILCRRASVNTTKMLHSEINFQTDSTARHRTCGEAHSRTRVSISAHCFAKPAQPSAEITTQLVLSKIEPNLRQQERNEFAGNKYRRSLCRSMLITARYFYFKLNPAPNFNCQDFFLTPASAAAGARESSIEDGPLKLAQHKNHASAPAVRSTQS
jgi:hypothetical protein